MITRYTSHAGIFLLITIETAEALLFKYYGRAGNLTPLDGDEDRNFRVETADGKKYTFKIMHRGCKENAVALPCAALQHLVNLAANIPRVIPSVAGNLFESVRTGEDANDHRFVWLLSWCSGTLLVDFSPHTESLYRSFGRTLAAVDMGLRGFSHPAMHIQSRWQLTSAMQSASKVDDIEGETREIARDIFARFETSVLGKLSHLPAGVIHNDANDYNVLVNGVDRQACVNGLFDFGDVCWQPIICEVAIALAYLIHRKDDPLAVCASFLEAYCEVYPLSEPELAVLFDLICTRLAVTVAISSHRKKREPENEYIVYSQRPSKNAMLALKQIGPERAQTVFMRACGLLPIKSGKGIDKLI